MRTFLSLYAKTSIMLVSVLAAVIGGEAVVTFYLGASRYHFVLMLSVEAMIALFLYRTFTCTKSTWVDIASMGNVMFWVVLLITYKVGGR